MSVLTLALAGLIVWLNHEVNKTIAAEGDTTYLREDHADEY